MNGQIDKLKIALIEFDKHVQHTVISDNEMFLQQLETENSHLRKLMNIQDELFQEDPEDNKRKEAEKKKKMLKSIDEKLKQAEKKIAKKQSIQDIYV